MQAARAHPYPAAVQAALDEFDRLLVQRAERRREATRALVAELYAHDGVEPAPERVDPEAEVACAQEREERLAAELRRLVPADPTAARTARTRSVKDLDYDCLGALRALGEAPASLREFQQEAGAWQAAKRAILARLIKHEAETAARLEAARGWQVRARRRLRRALAQACRDRQAAERRGWKAAARLAAIQRREAERAAWLAQPEIRALLGRGAAALRELADRAELSSLAETAELPVVVSAKAGVREARR
jgi:hypothetical protein